MDSIIHDLKQQLLKTSTHQLDHILDELYSSYVNTTPEDQDGIKAAFQVLHTFIQGFSFTDQAQIFCIIIALCSEHDRVEFLEGIRIGSRLILELLEV